MSVLPVGMGSSGVDVGDIPASLRFRSSASAYLSKTPGSTTSRQKWIAFIPFKVGGLGTARTLISASGSSRVTYITLNANNKLVIYSATAAGGGDGGEYISTRVFRDPTSWQFLVVAYDSTQATAGNRIKAWVGNEQITAWDTSTAPTINHDTQFNWTGAQMQIGAYSASQFFDGYIARLCISDGGSGDNTTFGYLNTEINEWVSKSQSEVKAVVDAGGANSFMLDFDDATSLTTLGYDKSSKGNNWTCNNISLTAGVTYDHMLDVPGNSYAVLNAISTGRTLSAANLDYAGAASGIIKGTIGVSSGKWYAEYRAGGIASLPGICSVDLAPTTTYLGNTSNSWGYNASTGVIYNNGGSAAYGATFTTGDIIGIALDMDAGTLVFYKNGVSQGTAATGLTGTLTFGAGSNSTNCLGSFNFGQRPFAYTPPTGFKALCQANLPEVPTALLDPTDHHIDITVTKSGNTNFTLPWDASVYDTFFEIKRRDAAGDWYQIDGLRGYDKILKSNSTAAETTDANVLGVSGTTGTLKSTLPNGVYIISATKAGLSSARQTNTDGSITSTVSRNVDSGFSIVLYTGTGAAGANVGHGLGVAPSMAIFKRRDAANDWPVYHTSLGATQGIYLDKTNAAGSSAAFWNNTSPTSSVISMGASSMFTGSMVAYCYADSPIQKSFSYKGNGSTDGPYVNLGFKCGRVVIKKSSAAGFDWLIYDSVRDSSNVTDLNIRYNTSGLEGTQTANYLDIVALGLKMRGDNTGSINSSGTHIGHAWAATTGKYSLAR